MGDSIMHRIIWFKVGDTRLHLLKLAGAFLIVTFALKVMEGAYQIFLTMEKIKAAEVNPALIPQFFGWAMGATPYPSNPSQFMLQDLIGVMMGPTATFMFWLGLLVVSLMVYQYGKIMFPVEEYAEQLPAHHRRAIVEAVRAHHARLAREREGAQKKARR
jgi:hypothetical protein